MYIAAVTAEALPNLSGRNALTQPLAIVLGEDNSGKSNLIDALPALPTGRRIRREDFRQGGYGARTADTMTLEADLAGLGLVRRPAW
jgi:recombinational DNA repair ATPase RecF